MNPFFFFYIMENTEFTAYKKNSSRHGHDNDMLDENQVRQVAGCIALDVMHRRVLLISSRKKKNTWVLVKKKKKPKT